MSFVRSEIPKVENLEKIMNELEAQFRHSLENVQIIQAEISDISTINNQTEKTDYFMDAESNMDYLLQDYRMDDYSSLMETMQKLKEFKKVLDAFESTDHLFPLEDYEQ